MNEYDVEWKPAWDINGPMRRWKMVQKNTNALMERLEHLEPGCRIYRIYILVYGTEQSQHSERKGEKDGPENEG